MTSAIDQTIVVLYYTLLVILSSYALHRIHLIRLGRRAAEEKESDFVASAFEWPTVTVQLPLYNEASVAIRLIRAVSRLEYAGGLSVQVLDDSTDETSQIVAAEVERLSSRGLEIVHIQRRDRTGFKAGALAEGMDRATSNFFAVFDADFVPGHDFLIRTIPRFADEGIGMVQARWGHINRDDGWLTRLQAIYLDGHFGVESYARFRGGRFFNFNGTAGVWRRQAIVDAGGWSADTVTEDLDLSYRAQMQGWRFVFQYEHEVCAELPGTLSTFHGQQHRWAKGSIQTARKLLGPILRDTLPWATKVEAFFHLTNNVAYLLTLVLALLLVPSVLIRMSLGWSTIILFDFVLFFLSTGSLVAFYTEGQRRVGRPRPTMAEIVSLVPFGIGLSVNNASAVLEGLLRRGGDFNRTPKRGDESDTVRLDKPPRLPLGEMLLAGFYLFAAASLIGSGIYLPLPFVGLFLSGYVAVSIGAIAERFRFREAITEESLDLGCSSPISKLARSS